MNGLKDLEYWVVGLVYSKIIEIFVNDFIIVFIYIDKLRVNKCFYLYIFLVFI